MDSGTFPAHLKGSGAAYGALMFAIYKEVVQVGLLNFMGNHVPVPTNLNLAAWEKLVITPDQHRVVTILTFGFPVGYEEEVPSPSIQNHAYA